MQQTDSDIAKPLFKTDLGHGIGVDGSIMCTRRVLYKNAWVKAAGRGQHDKLQLHLAYKTINTFTMHQTNFINNILTSCPVRSGPKLDHFSFVFFLFFLLFLFCFNNLLVLFLRLYQTNWLLFFLFLLLLLWLTCRNCCSHPR